MQQSLHGKFFLLDYWEQFFDSLTNFFFIQDTDFRFIKVNKAFADYLGLKPEEIEGRYCYEIVHGTNKPPPECPHLHLTADMEVKSFETFEQSLGGDVLITISPIVDDSGELIGTFHNIRNISTEKEIRKQLSYNEKFLRSIIDNEPECVKILDRDGMLFDMNPAGLRMIEAESLEQVVGQQVYGLVAPEYHEAFQKLTESVCDGNSGTLEFQMIGLKGVRLWLETHAVPLRDEDNDETYLLAVTRDVTARKKAEQALRKSQEMLSLAVQATNLGPWDWDLRTNEVYFSPEWKQQIGYKEHEIPGKYEEWENRLHPEDRNRVLDAVQSYLENRKEKYEVEFRLRHKDGTYRWIYTRALLLRDVNDEPYRMLGCHVDITERKLIEEALKAEKKRLAESQRIARIGSWEHNLETNEVYWSDELFRLLSLDREEDGADFDLFFRMVHPDDQPLLKNSIHETLHSRKPFNIDYRFICKDGSIRIIRAMAELIPDSSGKLVILSGTGQDITERKQVEEKIQKSEEYIRNILDTVDEGFIVVDRDYRITTANKAYCSQICLSSEEVLGRCCYEVSHGLERPCFEMGEECAAEKVFETGDFYTVVHEHTTKDDETLFVEIKAFPNKDEAGNVNSVIEVIRNITEKHLLEAEQLKTQKLEAVGRLAGGIAHDFNNMLQGVFGNISMAQLHADDPDKVTELLSQAEKALSLSVNLTNQLLTFAKGGKPALEITDLKPVLENTAKFSLSGSNCKFRLSIPQDLWHSESDAGQVAQVIQNIVLNANEAMPDGGTITIAAENIEIPRGKNVHLPGGGKYVMITFRDTGTGIPERYLSRIFDPYFTTKEQGSGLGLATSYSILKNHGGAIEVISEPGTGTTFSVYLPASASRKEEAAATPEVSTTAKFRILVMDDEEVVLDVAHGMLMILGHEMEGVTNGASAVEKYRQGLDSENPFDIVILDLTIKGGLGGAATITKLLEIDQNVKAIVASGYSDNAVVSNFKDFGFSALLNKPYTLAELRDCLSRFIK